MHLSEPMKTALLAVGNLYWTDTIRGDTLNALQRRALTVRGHSDGVYFIGLTQKGMDAYWTILNQLRAKEQ